MFNLVCPCGLPLPLGSSRGWELLATVAMGVSTMVTPHPSPFCLLSRGLVRLWGWKQLRFQRTSSPVCTWGVRIAPGDPMTCSLEQDPEHGHSWIFLMETLKPSSLNAEELLDSKPGSPELGASRVCTE